MSVASALEIAIVLPGRKTMTADAAEQWVEDFLATGTVTLRPVTVDQMRIARAAYMRFGNGTGHPAQLNFADCFAHALAKALNAPLLFKGNDFGRTDVERAI